MGSPVGHFRELTTALEQGRELPPDVVVWLHDGCARFKAGEGKTLCGALGLRRAGLDLPSTAYARATRNEALAAALALVEGDSEWPRCKELGRMIRRFESTTWPRVRTLDDPPARLTEIQAHLFAAFKACSNVPQSTKRLHELLTPNPPFSCE